MPTLAKSKFCTGCMACKDACRYNAIDTNIRNGMTFPLVNHELCAECKACERVCPIVNPQRKNLVEDMRVYGGWAKNPEIRFKGASGGAFAGIALSYIKAHRGNVAVYGAALRDNNVRHERIISANEISLLMNSKYIQSETSGIYRKVIEDLKQNMWVLFSGTPCQVAALYAFLGKKRNNEQLMTVEVVCHGVASSEALDIHLQHYNSKRIFSFRNKEEGQGWMTSQCTTIEHNGQPYRLKRKDDVFYKIYAGWMLDRKSCSNCHYSTLNRVADITIADFWGAVRDFHEYDKGVNVIVANNPRAYTFIREASELCVYGSTLGKAVGGNPHFYNGYKYIQYHPVVMWPNFFRWLLPRKIWIRVIKNDMPFKLLWGIFKVMTMLHVKKEEKTIRRKYGKILDEWLSGGGKILNTYELR